EMPVGSIIFALVFYPLLFNLPLNFVRLLWGYRQGLAPMPPHVQTRAEVVDRAVVLVMYMILLATVISLLNRSLLSLYAVGLTTANWKSAMAFGVLVSYVPVGLGALLHRFLPTDKPEEEPASRGPLAVWCGLTLLGGLSVELWRAVSIAALTRLELSPWFAVLLAAVAYGASQLSTSTAKAAGAVTFGALAGFLFVKTGSLMAPFAMNLTVAGAELYRVRHMASRGEIRQSTRRNVICPSCNAGFNPGNVRRAGRSFLCPECGEVLEHETGTFAHVLFGVCLYGVPALLYYLGYRSLRSIALSIAAALVIFYLGITIHSLIFPPKAQLHLKYGESGLHFADKPKVRDDHRPTDD
ncbi:MAG: CPBP family glutamic-type intramembrane protease, partial [Candidatus Acidiferrum sp.]